MLTEQLLLEQLRDLKKKSLAFYQAWDKTKAISIVYTGAQATATAEVKAGTLELAAPAASVVRTIDLAAIGTDTLQEVVNDINTFGSGFAAALGDQFDGDEAAIDLTIAGPSSVKTTTVWFAHDVNIEIRVTIPAIASGKSVKITKIIGKATYTGAGTIKVYKDGVLVWTEDAGATTVEKTATIYALSGELGETLLVKLCAATTMTAGYLSVSYEQKDAQPFSV